MKSSMWITGAGRSNNSSEGVLLTPSVQGNRAATSGHSSRDDMKTIRGRITENGKVLIERIAVQVWTERAGGMLDTYLIVQLPPTLAPHDLGECVFEAEDGRSGRME